MEPAIPTGQEILEQLNQLAGEYALSGNNSTMGGGQEGCTNAGGSRQEALSSAESGTKSPENVVDDHNVANAHHPLIPPRPASPTPALAPAPPTKPLALSSAAPTLAPPPPASPSVVEAPISSRLRARPENSQKSNASLGIVPDQDQQVQSKKRKAPKETAESAKRAKTIVENTTTNTTTAANRAAARSAGVQPRKHKQKNASNSSTLNSLP